MGKHMELQNSETVSPCSSNFPSSNATNDTIPCNSRRQSTDNLPLISVQFIEDSLKAESESRRRLDLKPGSVLDKSLESIMGVASPTHTNSDKRNADQMFNYFLKKIKNEASSLELSTHQSVRYHQKALRRQSVMKSTSDESAHSTVCDIEEETMISALSSSESSCCSPGDTPSYGSVPNRRSIDSFDSKLEDMDYRNSSCWESYGDPIHIEVVSQMDSPLTLRVFYSLMRHRASNTVVRVGEAILLRDPNQQWFDRLPQVVEILQAYEDVSVDPPTSLNAPRELRVTLRRYYRSDQLLCVLPNIAIEMASREAVVFSSSRVEPFQADSAFIAPCLLLSLPAFYRFWAEVTRLRHGRMKRRNVLLGNQRENWHDWLATPERVFVICGDYDHVTRVVDEVAEPLLELR